MDEKYIIARNFEVAIKAEDGSVNSVRFPKNYMKAYQEKDLDSLAAFLEFNLNKERYYKKELEFFVTKVLNGTDSEFLNGVSLYASNPAKLKEIISLYAEFRGNRIALEYVISKISAELVDLDIMEEEKEKEENGGDDGNDS